MPGSAGYDSKIVLGDEVVSVNDVPLEQSRRLILSGQEHRRRLFFIQVDIDEEIQIEYRRRQNSQSKVVDLKARQAVPAEGPSGAHPSTLQTPGGLAARRRR